MTKLMWCQNQYSPTQVGQWYGTYSTSHFGLCPLSNIKNKLNTMCQRQPKGGETPTQLVPTEGAIA